MHLSLRVLLRLGLSKKTGAERISLNAPKRLALHKPSGNHILTMKPTTIKMHRPETRLDRSEYLVRAHEFAKRGEDLPHTKLDRAMLDDIKSAIKQRESLRQYIANNLSNDGLARRFGVHKRTIERAIHENRL